MIQSNDRLPGLGKSWLFHVSKRICEKRAHPAGLPRSWYLQATPACASALGKMQGATPGPVPTVSRLGVGDRVRLGAHCGPSQRPQADWWLQLPALHLWGENSAKPYIRGINLLHLLKFLVEICIKLLNYTDLNSQKAIPQFNFKIPCSLCVRFLNEPPGKTEPPATTSLRPTSADGLFNKVYIGLPP